MPKTSAGILLYRHCQNKLQVLLAHPGGPYWARKDLGSWTIPKGEFEPPETAETAAHREFAEETGMEIEGTLRSLGDCRNKGGKIIYGFAAEGDFDCATLQSNKFEIEWPPRSGQRAAFPEIDRSEWFGLPMARQKIHAAQLIFLDRLEVLLTQTGQH